MERASPRTAQPRGVRWRLTRGFTERSRRGRFLTFMRLMQPRDEETVLDVGVNDSIWRSSNFLEALYPWPGSITAVAPQPVPAFAAAFPDVRVELADGRRLPFADDSFDIGFSNAVIEHVGSRDQQRLFVAEMVRTCRRSFICTPNRGFPVDPHTLLPFVHWLPRRLWYAALRRTRNGRWATEEMLNPLGAKELLALFPPGAPVRIERQRVLGLTSVLIAVVEGRQDDG